MASFEWIDTDQRFRLAFRPRPASDLPASLAAWRRDGASHIVSFQTEEESARMGLSQEGAIAAQIGLGFERFGVIDHAVPDDVETAIGFARKTVKRLDAGEGVVFHCYAGVGRSGLMAILTLMVAGFDLHDARIRATAARGFSVPENQLQLQWLRRAADHLPSPSSPSAF